MNLDNILNAKLLRKSNINTESYHNYIRKVYFKEDCDITKIYPNLVFIDSNNIETFWIDSGNDGTIVLDLHMVDLIHFFSMISGHMFQNKIDLHNTILIDSYILSNNYLVKGYLEYSMFYLKLYINQINCQQNFLYKLSDNILSINYELQLMRGVQIHYILLHEMGHIQYRKKNVNISLYNLIIKEINKFNCYANTVNNYDISQIEEILIKNKNKSTRVYYKNVMKECESLYNNLSKNEQKIFKAVIENYYEDTKMDIIDLEKDIDIVEECYCDLYAIKIIFENFYFTSRCLSVDNYKLIINSIICASTCINLVKSIKEISDIKSLEKDKILLRKEIFRPILYKMINYYNFVGKIKKDANFYLKHYCNYNEHNELLYRLCIEFVIYNRENNLIKNDIGLFSDEWYRIREYINKNLKLPFLH